MDVTDTSNVPLNHGNLTSGSAEHLWENLESKRYQVKIVYDGDDNYMSAQSEVIDLDLTRKPQTGFALTSIDLKTYGQESFTLETTGGNGSGMVSFESQNPDVISVSGNLATIHKAGQATIVAKKAQDEMYLEAIAQTQVRVLPKRLEVRAHDKQIKVNEPRLKIRRRRANLKFSSARARSQNRVTTSYSTTKAN